MTRQSAFKYECRFARAWVVMLLLPLGIAVAIVVVALSFLWEAWESGVPRAVEVLRDDLRDFVDAVRSRLRWVLK